MANLVTPVYRLQPIEEKIVEFKGLNRKTVIEDGEMPSMLNLSSDDYPLITPRKLRGKLDLPEGVVRPYGLISRFDRLGMIAEDEEENVYFYFDGEKITSVTGITTQTRMVAINTKICFFPQKTYLELVKSGSHITIGAYGSLEESETLVDAEVTISNENVNLSVPSGHTFGYDDAVNINGTLTYTPDGGSETTAPFVVSCIVEESENTVLTLPRETFIELTGEGAQNISLSGTISRTMPDIDHVIEWNNRLWGASNADNTIYACKLGDPKNWQYFQGTSMDSYYAQQGSDGDWTGVAGYSGHIIFFKQTSMTRIYGTTPSNYQVANMDCYGVEDGSRQSVVTINDKVFYKSTTGIMAYDGGVPYLISEKLNAVFKGAVAGTEGMKYYVSMQNKAGGYELFTLDIGKAEWHKEDSLRFRNCCTNGSRLYYVTASDGELFCSNDTICSDWLLMGTDDVEGHVGIINPVVPDESYESLEWMAQFGPFDEYIENRKIYSKLALRLKAKGPSHVKVYMSLNEGEWELVHEFDPAVTEGHFIPIVPRRCDRYSVKIEGTGNCEIKSLTRHVRRGTGLKL